MDFIFTSEELNGMALNRNTEAANQEVRSIIVEWINQNVPCNKGLLLGFLREANKVMLSNIQKDIDKTIFPKGFDDKILSRVDNYSETHIRKPSIKDDLFI